ncbi:MAG TPA: hypothetical protein VGN17_13475 [Bryobacteraceae bacterium]
MNVSAESTNIVKVPPVLLPAAEAVKFPADAGVNVVVTFQGVASDVKSLEPVIAIVLADCVTPPDDDWLVTVKSLNVLSI